MMICTDNTKAGRAEGKNRTKQQYDLQKLEQKEMLLMKGKAVPRIWKSSTWYTWGKKMNGESV